MSKTNFQDPGSSEIISPTISGLQEAVGKIEDVLNMQTTSENNITLSEVYIDTDDRYRIYQAPVGKRNWVSSTTPVIKKNGVTISEGFTIEYSGGAIVLAVNALSTDVFTADATYVIATSNVAKKDGTVQTNLNAEMLDSKHADDFIQKDNYVQSIPYIVTTGSANTYAVTLSPIPGAYVDGMAIAIKVNVDSTGVSTINVNGLGAKAIKKANGTDVTNLKANGIYTMRYNGTNFILQSENGFGISSINIRNVLKVTQTEYDAITTPDSSTLYVIVG